MPSNRITVGREFGLALCKHFGLPASKVDHKIKINASADDILSVTLDICLTADDLTAIAEHMRASTHA
jgi:hypothetical protein